MQALAEERDCFYYDELSDEAKENARNWYRGEDNGLDYDWWDSVYEDTKEIGKLMGIDIEEIYFSGFWSQGDGACFVGNYEYKPGFVEAVKEYAATDNKLHDICRSLLDAQAKNLFCMSAYISKHNWHYYP